MTTRLHVQRYVGVVIAALLLSACQSRTDSGQPSLGASTTALGSTTKAVQRLAPSTLPLVTTPGTWLHPPKGPLFEPMDTLDPRNAMVYIYRPSTAWEDQELQAPSFFVDGVKVFGLKSGSYTWLELHSGEYQFYAKRPLLILFIKKIFEMQMSVAGGQNYYLRYSEDAPFDYRAEGLNPDDFMSAGFLQEVPESVALLEIASLKLDQQGVYFEAGRIAQQRWQPFETFPETGADPDDVAVSGDAEEAGELPADEGWWQKTRSFFGDMFHR